MRPLAPEGGFKPEVSTEIFSIRYSGPALESGEMDVRDLAPALFALGSLFEEANAVLNGPDTKATLQVRSSFDKGSFVAHLHLGVTWYEHIRTFLLGKPKDAKELLEILGFYGTLAAGTVKGVLWLIKAIGARKVTGATSLGDGTTNIFIENHVTINAEDRTWDLYRRRSVIQGFQAIAAPIGRDGVDELQVKHDDEAASEIVKDDLPAIYLMRENSPEPDLVSESTVTKVYEVITGSKTPEYIWRLWDGETTLSLHIEDQQFFEDISNGKVVVSLGDYLQAEVHSATRIEKGKLKTVTRVKRVLSHVPRKNANESQPRLDFDH
jgi:hypothetical protein